ncbi:hypothetical protein KXD40_006805 [Peronospora effusa]|nr:hypothetical protein KXD40_006805 [Peronospora effusa]
MDAHGNVLGESSRGYAGQGSRGSGDGVAPCVEGATEIVTVNIAKKGVDRVVIVTPGIIANDKAEGNGDLESKSEIV